MDGFRPETGHAVGYLIVPTDLYVRRSTVTGLNGRVQFRGERCNRIERDSAGLSVPVQAEVRFPDSAQLGILRIQRYHKWFDYRDPVSLSEIRTICLLHSAGLRLSLENGVRQAVGNSFSNCSKRI